MLNLENSQITYEDFSQILNEFEAEDTKYFTEIYEKIIKSYYPQGGLSHESFYIGGMLAKVIQYYSSNTIQSTNHIPNSNLQNIQMSHIIYDHNQKISRIVYFSHNGTKTNENYFNPKGLITMEIHYDSGSQKVYQGNTNEGKYDKQGTLFKNGIMQYTGSFKNGLKQGHGKSFDEDSRNCEYEGEWSLNKMSGYGTSYYDTNFIKFRGYFLNGFYEGEGTLYNRQNQIVYKGSFQDGKFCGEGVQFLNGGKSYSGLFENGLANGYGKEYWTGTAEVKKSGYWVNGKLIKGCLYNINGGIEYDGYWGDNGQTEGYGVIFRPDGRKRYEGHTKNLTPSGIGTVFYNSCEESCRGKWVNSDQTFYELSKQEEDKGYASFKQKSDIYNENLDIYVGQVQNMVPNGWGKLLSPFWGNKLYQGNWKLGKKSGYGVEYYTLPKNSHVEYSGGFLDGKKEGLGNFWDLNGILRFRGFWKEDKLVGAEINDMRQGNHQQVYQGNGNMHVFQRNLFQFFLEGPADGDDGQNIGVFGNGDEVQKQNCQFDSLSKVGYVKPFTILKNSDGSLGQILV